MGKYNTKTKTVVAPTTTNEMGERAYVLSAKEELVSTILTTFLQASYYEKENDIVKRIISAAEKCDPLFVAKAALYARGDANMRSVSHLLAGELASKLSSKEWSTRFFRKIIQRPDDMSEIIAYLKHVNSKKGEKLKIPNAIKRAFRSYLSGMDPYLIDKYKMKGKEFSLKVLLKLLHPSSSGDTEKAFNLLMNGKDIKAAGLYTSTILQKAKTSAGQQAVAEGATKEDKEAYLGESIAEVLNSQKGMPIFNLVRNLRNIIEQSPDLVDTACAQLTDPKRIAGSRMLPFRFATAYQEIEKLLPVRASSSSRIKFEQNKDQATGPITKVLSALEKAIEYSVKNISKLEGNTAILVDHSGSVRGDGGGASKVSAFSKVTKAMIGNLFGSMMLYSQDNCYLGLFGDRLVTVPIDRKMGMLEFTQQSFRSGDSCGAGTENGLYIFLYECVKNKTRVDNLIIFSDMVIGSGGEGGWDRSSRAGLGSFQELFKHFKAVNPQCNTVCINIGDTSGKSVFHRSLGLTQVSGWSDKIFDIIGTASRGYDALIKEIEAIKV